MARFNSPSASNRKPRMTTNAAGGQAFVKSAKLEFVGRLLTNFLQSTFYQKGANQTIRVADLVPQLDPLFAAKAAIYARNVFGMRSVTHVVAAELAAQIRSGYKAKGLKFGQPWFRRFFDKVVARPDDMTEIMSYFLTNYGKPIPNSVKRGFADAFTRFDGYQLAKNRGENKDLTLSKLAKLVWPKVTDKNQDAIQALWKNELVSVDTWESKLSAAGMAGGAKEVAAAKEDAWQDLLVSGKIGQFALLRNLRNIAEQAPALIPNACDLLTVPERVKNSKIFPFRYFTAYKEVTNAAMRGALEQAVNLSLDNVPKLDGRTLVALDCSGSMRGKPFEIGAMFASVLAASNNCPLVIFSGDAKEVQLMDTGVMQTIKYLDAKAPYGGTNFHAVFQWAARQKKPFDRIVILSDGEAWMGYKVAENTLNNYGKDFGEPKVYFFDLEGSNTLQFRESKLFYVPGFSEKVFDLMAAMEAGPASVIAEIEKVVI